MKKKIAIIGGGPFGIMSAARLSADPNNEITIFEQSENIGGLSKSVSYKGNQLDFTTKFIPANSFSGAGMPAVLEEYIKRTNSLIEPAGHYNFIHQGKEVSLFPPHSKYSKVKILSDAYKCLDIFPELDKHKNISSLLNSSNLFKANESWEEMGQRLGIESITDAFSYIMHVFGSTPCGMESTSILLSRNNFSTVSYLKKFFSDNKSMSQLLNIIKPKNIFKNKEFAKSNFYLFSGGYDHFLRNVLKQHPEVKIRTNVKVHKVETTEMHNISDANGEFLDAFHEVVFALPFECLKKIECKYTKLIMDKYDSLYNAYIDNNIPRTNTLISAFCNIQSKEIWHLPRGIYLDSLNVNNVGSFKVDKKGGSLGLYKHFDADNLCQILGFCNELDVKDITEEMIVNSCYEIINRLGYQCTKRDIKPYAWHIIRWNPPFWKKGTLAVSLEIEKNQGLNGIWIGGEQMIGPGIPTIINYVENLFGDFVFNS